MKKFFMLISIGIMIITMAGCVQKDLTDNDFNQIQAGMTTDEVKRKLGEPQKIVVDDEAVYGQMNKENENEDPEDAPQIYYEFAGGTEEDLIELDDKIMKSNNLSYYHYEYGNSDYQNIYFADDEVVWRTF